MAQLCFWKSQLKAGEILGATSNERAVSVSMDFWGLGVIKLTSVYGLVGFHTKTLDLLNNIFAEPSGAGSLIVGGDFDIPRGKWKLG